tara:strand:- start:83 stop:385 length:303 start_codon:yes stop_codon:yes gene_type:complete
MDWADSNGESDREKCVDALGEWFDGLSAKTKLAIFYAQQYGSDKNADYGVVFDPWNDGCPWLAMLFAAQDRIIRRHAPWVLGEHGPTSGYNFQLYVHLER